MVQKVGSNPFAGKIQSNFDDMSTRLRSGSGNASESDMRATSKKDLNSIIGAEKDELSYEFTNHQNDQAKEFNWDDWDSLSDMFQ